MNVVVATAFGTQFCFYSDNGMQVIVRSQAQQETEHTLPPISCTLQNTLHYYVTINRVHTYIQGVPGGMDETSGECSLC